MKKLFFVSLGPGDYELLTIKALKALQKSEVICIPTKSKGSFKRSLAYLIIEDIKRDFNLKAKLYPVYVPMKFNPKDWERESEEILGCFENFDTVSFVTLGDAAIYSTIYYLADFIKEKEPEIYENLEVIPGISSFSLASAKIKKPLCLGESALLITPFSNINADKTVVYMRGERGEDTSFIKESGEFYTFERLSLKGEKIISKKVDKIEHYMTLLIDFFNPNKKTKK